MIFFDFGVLLIYGRISTFIFFYFSTNHPTPILAIKILVIWANLKKSMRRTRRMEKRKILGIWWRTMFGPN